MKLTVDTDNDTLTVIDEDGETTKQLFSPEGFRDLSDVWLKVGWNQKHLYTFTWMGRPIIQLPDDVMRMQEVIYRLKPDVIVECGVAHGGSLVLYASLCKAMGKGRVVGVDIEIRPHNRRAIEEHDLKPLITLIEGDSASPRVVDQVRSAIGPDDTVLIILDSDHSREHVLRELEAYHDLVTPGSYIVATDGIIRSVADAPRGDESWTHSNPSAAAVDFVEKHPEFEIVEPGRDFDESMILSDVTHWPQAWLKRRDPEAEP